MKPAGPESSPPDLYHTPDLVSYRREEKHQRPGHPSWSERVPGLLQIEPPAPVHGMFAMPDEDAAEAVAAAATHRILAIPFGAAEAFVNTAELNKLWELDLLPTFDGNLPLWSRDSR